MQRKMETLSSAARRRVRYPSIIIMRDPALSSWDRKLILTDPGEMWFSVPGRKQTSSERELLIRWITRNIHSLSLLAVWQKFMVRRLWLLAGTRYLSVIPPSPSAAMILIRCRLICRRQFPVFGLPGHRINLSGKRQRYIPGRHWGVPPSVPASIGRTPRLLVQPA